jgi:GntR family transcriptional regulator
MSRVSDKLEIAIDKTSFIPLHVQIECLLRDLIKGGYFEKLEIPITEKFLQEQLNVSRNTVQQTVSKLVDEGLIIMNKSFTANGFDFSPLCSRKKAKFTYSQVG